MADMIAAVYKNQYRAMENMARLRKLDEDWLVDIQDAVAVARDANGKLHIQDSFKPTPQAGAGWGALLGTVLAGLALAPFTGGLSAATAAGGIAAGTVGGATLGGLTGAAVAETDKVQHGLSEEFVTEVSDAIKRGQSAIFALVEVHDPDYVANYFRGTGGRIIRTSLGPHEQQRLQEILAGRYTSQH